MKIEVLHHDVLYDVSGKFGAWPSLARTKEGELLTVFSGDRKNHVDPYGKTLLVRSTDNGHNWSEPQVVVNTPFDDRDPGILVLPDGRWLVSLFNSRMFVDWRKKAVKYYGSKEVARWQPYIDRLTEKDFQTGLGNFTLISDDQGINWSQLRAAPVHAPHGPIIGQAGELLYLGSQPKPGGAEINCYASVDGGENWQLRGLLSDSVALAGHTLCEPHLVQLADGRLLGQLRVNAVEVEKRTLLQCISSDGGCTWSSIESTNIWGVPPHLLLHSSGLLLSTYGHRREPFGQRVAISTDNGKSWPTICSLNEVTFQDESIASDVTAETDKRAIYYQQPDLGYPATIELADSSLYTVWYQSRPSEEGAMILGCQWRLLPSKTS